MFFVHTYTHTHIQTHTHKHEARYIECINYLKRLISKSGKHYYTLVMGKIDKHGTKIGNFFGIYTEKAFVLLSLLVLLFFLFIIIWYLFIMF